MTQFDAIIIGAGAAGLMCAATAGQRSKRVLLLDHSKKIGEKIRISGGGRCNFTNIYTSAAQFLSSNPHFCKSALKQYTQHDFIALVEQHGIAYHEKTLGQLFCNESAQQIIDMLLQECADGDVDLRKETSVESVAYNNGTYQIQSSAGSFTAPKLVIASGGLSIPKIGASNFGYKIAQQFVLDIIPTRAGLVPLTFQAALLERCKALSGVSAPAASVIAQDKTRFDEALLFTHRGLSGPSILQISSYWQEGEAITVNLIQDIDILSALQDHKSKDAKKDIQTVLADYLPKRLAASICEAEGASGRMADLSNAKLQALSAAIQNWQIKPSGTEGYRTAEVTLGGVDTNALSSKTMEVKSQPGLYFIGEVVDVTGWLGGYNFQWAWSSGVACGRAL